MTNKCIVNGDKEAIIKIVEPTDLSNRELAEIILTALTDKDKASQMIHKKLYPKGYTEYDVKKNDIITDERGRTFKVTTRESYYSDGEFGFFGLDLEQKEASPKTENKQNEGRFNRSGF